MAEWILHRPRVKGRNATYKCSNCGRLCSSYYNDVGEWKCCPHCMTPITRTPKERGADKPKITCLNCKHLIFSDMYGECNKQLRIVNPGDTCEFAELKERGVEK